MRALLSLLCLAACAAPDAHADADAAAKSAHDGGTCVALPDDVTSCLPAAATPSWSGAAPTLALTPGRSQAKTLTFQPFLDKAPLICGVQGGFHVPLALQVTLPGATAAKVPLDLDATLHVGCTLVARSVDAQIFVVQAPGPDGAYQTVPGDDRRVIFGACNCGQIPRLAGRSAALDVQIRDPATGARGHVTRDVVLEVP